MTKLLAFLTAIAMIVFAFVSTPRSREFPFPGGVEPKTARSLGEALAPGLPTRLLSYLASPAPVVGLIREIPAPVACQSATGNPIAVVGPWPPTAGRTFQITWNTTACPVPPPPECFGVLLFSTKPMDQPFDLTAFGAPGCHLVVHPEFALAPDNSPGSSFRQIGGYFDLQWTPGPEMVGTDFYCQFAVQRPGKNDLGWLVSQGLHITIGG